ncbi:MAG: hypothetical protein QXP36_10430 [Conexivisphaerales archaeon]
MIRREDEMKVLTFLKKERCKGVGVGRCTQEGRIEEPGTPDSLIIHLTLRYNME